MPYGYSKLPGRLQAANGPHGYGINGINGDTMANEYQPRIGDWYKSINGDKFEIVALDTDVATMEIQHFDGSIEELDFDSWEEMEIITIEPPEDWSGSLDIQRDDYGVDLELTSPNDHINPLDEFE